MPDLIATTNDIKTLSLGIKLYCSSADLVILVISVTDADHCKIDLTSIDCKESLSEPLG